jgi:hypothetical protein
MNAATLKTNTDFGSSHFVDAIHVGEKFGPMTIMILSMKIQINQLNQ